MKSTFFKGSLGTIDYVLEMVEDLAADPEISVGESERIIRNVGRISNSIANLDR